MGCSGSMDTTTVSAS